MKKENPTQNSSPEDLKLKEIKIISILGIVFSAVTVGSGILVMFLGGMLLSFLTAKGEGGWGILGIPVFFIGILVLFIGIAKLISYLLLTRIKKPGWFMVIILEGLSLIYRLYFTIEGFGIFFTLPLLWSLIVILFLTIRKKVFFPNPRTGRV